MPFLNFSSGSFAVQCGDHFRSGIICGPIWGSFAVRDHLRSWDHLRTRTAVFLRRKRRSYEEPYIVIRKLVLGCFLLQRQENNKLVGSLKRSKQLEKACQLPNFHAKIDSTITKYIGQNFTKVTTLIIIIIKNYYKNCYLGKIICKGSLV